MTIDLDDLLRSEASRFHQVAAAVPHNRPDLDRRVTTYRRRQRAITSASLAVVVTLIFLISHLGVEEDSIRQEVGHNQPPEVREMTVPTIDTRNDASTTSASPWPGTDETTTTSVATGPSMGSMDISPGPAAPPSATLGGNTPTRSAPSAGRPSPDPAAELPTANTSPGPGSRIGPPGPTTARPVVNLRGNGIGTATFGTTREEVVRKLTEDFGPPDPPTPEAAALGYVTFASGQGPQLGIGGLTLLFSEMNGQALFSGYIHSFLSVRELGLRTSSGIGVLTPVRTVQRVTNLPIPPFGAVDQSMCWIDDGSQICAVPISLKTIHPGAEPLTPEDPVAVMYAGAVPFPVKGLPL